MNPRALRETLLARLRTDAATGLAELLCDYALALPLEAVVDVSVAADEVVRALSGPAVDIAVREHWAAIVEAERERSLAAEETVSAYAPEGVVVDVMARLGRPIELPAGWADDVIDAGFVQRLIADALGDTLEDFLRSLPGFSGRATNLLSSLTRRAGRVDVSQVPFADRARDFARRGAGSFQERFLSRLNAKDNAHELTATYERAARALLALPTSAVLALLDDPGTQEVGEWVRDVLRHNMARDEIADTLKAQIEQAVERAAGQDQSVGSLLQRAGLMPEFRTHARLLVGRHVQALAATDEFAEWLDELLGSAMADPPEG